jgi:hypothetical protein
MGILVVIMATLREEGTVATVLLPEPMRGIPDGVALSWVDRETGLLLRSVSSPLPERLRGRIRTQLKDGRHAA